MAEDVFEVQLVSPEQILFEGDAEMVVCRALDGDIAFLKDHVPYLGVLADDAVRIIQPGATETAAAVHGGFVQMNGEKLVVLSDLAELGDDIDVARAEAAKAAAEAVLALDPDDEEAQAALARAETRLKVAGVSA
jgi:F-type H+-transporting ATPase subunit epsilon